MITNFFYGIIALTNDMGLFTTSILANKMFMGFIAGVMLTLMVTGFVLSKDPRHIPLILRYPLHESFRRIAPKNAHGMFQMAFSEFIKLYIQVRFLFLIAFIAFCIMVATVVLTYQKP